jgi:hypothetical protein
MESFIKSLPGICGEPLKRYWPDFKRLFTVKSEGFRITYSADLESNARTEARFADFGKKSHTNYNSEKCNIFLSVKRLITRKNSFGKSVQYCKELCGLSHFDHLRFNKYSSLFAEKRTSSCNSSNHLFFSFRNNSKR